MFAVLSVFPFDSINDWSLDIRLKLWRKLSSAFIGLISLRCLHNSTFLMILACSHRKVCLLFSVHKFLNSNCVPKLMRKCLINCFCFGFSKRTLVLFFFKQRILMKKESCLADVWLVYSAVPSRHLPPAPTPSPFASLTTCTLV